MTRRTRERSPATDRRSPARRLRVLVVAGGLAAAFGAMVLMVGIREPVWILAGMTALLAIGPAVLGMWRLKRWALVLSWVLAGCALVLGLYWVHFAWTFWLFHEPTFWDRVRAELKPIILLWWVTPSAWLWYFTRPYVTKHFTK